VIGRRPLIADRQKHSHAEQNPRKIKNLREGQKPDHALCWGRPAAPVGPL